MKRLLALLLAALLLLSLPVPFARADEDEPAADPPAQESVSEPSAPSDEPEPPALTSDEETTEDPADQDEPAAEEPPEPTADPDPDDGPTDENPYGDPIDDEGEIFTEDNDRPHHEPRWSKSLACWEQERADIVLTGNLREDILIIARSQLGYTADRTCYEEDEMGRLLFYTRYGAWNGAMFSEWCDMFVSFCVFYAGKEDYRGESSCARHMLALKRTGYWREWNSYLPQKGDIVFFAFSDETSMPTHVGLVEEVVFGEDGGPGHLITIEGNLPNPNGDMSCVGRMVRSLDRVVGYGTYEQDKVYPETYTVRSDGYQVIDPASVYFVEYPVEEVLRFLGLENTPYYDYWFSHGSAEEEPPEPPTPEPILPSTPDPLPKAQPRKKERLISWE